MTSKVCHQNVVTSHMLTLRQNGFGQPIDEPLSTFCAAGNHHGEVRACFVKYYSEGSQYQAANEPLDTLTTKPRRSEEHTSELQALMRSSYAVCRLKKTNHKDNTKTLQSINRHKIT